MVKQLVLAGLFTIGVGIGSLLPEASATVLQETVITSRPPNDACTEFQLLADDSVRCVDDGQRYDADHYMVTSDTDGPGFYLLVWQ